MAKNSEARIKANNKYNEKAYDRINIAVPKGYKEILQEIAGAKGLSVNGLLREWIDEGIQRNPHIMTNSKYVRCLELAKKDTTGDDCGNSTPPVDSSSI